MLAWETLALATGLLCLERRISYRRLCYVLDLDGDALEALQHELIVGKRLALDDNGEALVWMGDGASAFASGTSSTSVIAPASAAAVPHFNTLPATAERGASAASAEASKAAEAERRQLTVMFCDLVGSTALSTQMDPEDLRDVITSFQAKCQEAIKHYDGFIARYMGDGMLVYFGYPQAHEDDAERATRAGVDIVGAMAALNADIGEVHGVVLTVRVGIATGPVVVGDMIGEGAAEEAAVVGETPNLAARLQGVAQPNQVVISAATQRIVGDLFSFDDLGVHELKGIAQPTQAWRVSGVADIEDRNESRRQTGSSPLVGRQEELGLLLRAWQASKDGHGQVVLIQGEPGVGKSRLLEALREPLTDEDYTWVSIRCSPYYVSTPLYPVIEHFKRVMGWQPDDDAPARLAKLETALRTQSMPLEEIAPLIADLMSLSLPENRYPALEMTPQQQREAMLDAIAGWLFELAESKPVLQVWEDLHWADPTTLEFLGLNIEQSPTVAMLNVLTYRPEFVPPWPTRSHMTPITLNRLERPEVEAFVSTLAGGKALPAEVLEHIVSKADGVPLYVEELTKTIIESGVLREEAERYRLDGALAELQIPSTLQDSLMARLDRTPALREVAQMAAVLGREFAYDMLKAVIALEDAPLQSGLAQLVEDELLYQRGRGQRSRYIFKHALIQDAAYQSLLNRTRQQYHRQVAELLETRFPELVEVQPELVAHHYNAANVADRAVEYFHQAGDRSLRMSANSEAIAHLTRGLEVLDAVADGPARAERELAMLTALGPALIAARGYAAPEVEPTYRRALALCQEVGDAPQQFSALHGLWFFHYIRAELDDARSRAEQLVEMTEGQHDTGLNLAAHRALGYTLNFLGELQASRSHLEQVISSYDPGIHGGYAFRHGGADPGAGSASQGAWTLFALGYPDKAIAQAEQGVALARQLAHPFSEAWALLSVAVIHQLRGETEAALTNVEACAAVAKNKGFALYVGWAAIVRGSVLGQQDDSAEAICEIRRGLDASQATGAVLISPYWLALLAAAHGRLGQAQEGLAVVAEALSQVTRTGERFCEAELHRLKGQLLIDDDGGNEAEAEACFRSAIDVARSQAAKSWELRATMSLAQLLRRRGRGAEARELLAPAYAWFTEAFDTADLKDARSLLDVLEGPRSDAAVN